LSTKRKKMAAILTKTNTMPVVTIVSRRPAQVIFPASWRTSRTNSTGFFIFPTGLAGAIPLGLAGFLTMRPAKVQIGITTFPW
jgi:hypothetical protein